MIALIDYATGNICSVTNALGRIGAEWVLTADKSMIEKASHIILPGVGHAGQAFDNLRQTGLCDYLRALRKPVLGICVGMQILCRHTDEGNADCLGVFDCDVRRFDPADGDKVPNMGWSPVANLESKLFRGIDPGEMFYFVHSFYAPPCYDTIATARFGAENRMFSAALRYENFYGVQFHPEKSGEAGEKLLKNFLKIK